MNYNNCSVLFVNLDSKPFSAGWGWWWQTGGLCFVWRSAIAFCCITGIAFFILWIRQLLEGLRLLYIFF